MTPLREKKRVNLKKERVKNHRVISNALTVRNKSITQRTVTRNPNRIRQLKQKSRSQIKNENLSKKSTSKEKEIKPEKN
jgi:hypothetical protein